MLPIALQDVGQSRSGHPVGTSDATRSKIVPGRRAAGRATAMDIATSLRILWRYKDAPVGSQLATSTA